MYFKAFKSAPLSGQAVRPTSRREYPTVWGLRPDDLLDRFWAARGIQVVRQGQMETIEPEAELYLLTPRRAMTIFKLGRAINLLRWQKLRILFVRLEDSRDLGYREFAITEGQSAFKSFQRAYQTVDARKTLVALTPDPTLARAWKDAVDPREGWRGLRLQTREQNHGTISVKGRIHDAFDPAEAMKCVNDLMETWNRPDSAVSRVARKSATVWVDRNATVEKGARFLGPVWVGAGRTVSSEKTVVGPAVLWDAPESRPDRETIPWDAIEFRSRPRRKVTTPLSNRLSAASKRLFDFAFALLVLLLTLPLYPLVMLAIWLEDGWPCFFTHRRQTLGGKEFPCIKFRTMRKNAEALKEKLRNENQADGPQFYIEKDPRLLRIGPFLRKTNIDELPQFINVLLGHMSVVGPRPSPESENQFCPAWKEARLSVRPGVTGLWQVMRTRKKGLDFMEWIKYDIEYVENASWRLDLWIIWRTVRQILMG